MGVEVDLKSASREAVLEVIASRQAVMIELRRRVEDLERRGFSRGPSAVLGEAPGQVWAGSSAGRGERLLRRI